MIPPRRELGSILDSDTDEMPVEEILKTVGNPPTFEQIKQTVAETKAIINGGEYLRSPYREKLTVLLEIADHLQKTIDRKDSELLLAGELPVERRKTIEAQAAEIERLKKRINDIDPERKS